MVRRFDEPIEVQISGADAPTAFLWRRRLYAVRSVEGHWQERRSWWRDEGEGAGRGDRRVWRVHAQAGQGGRPGVFELGSDGPGPSGPWVLLCAQD